MKKFVMAATAVIALGLMSFSPPQTPQAEDCWTRADNYVASKGYNPNACYDGCHDIWIAYYEGCGAEK